MQQTVHKLEKNREQGGGQKKRKANTSAEAMESGKMKGGVEGTNSTCLRAFCSVALALIELSVRPTFALKFKLIQFC